MQWIFHLFIFLLPKKQKKKHTNDDKEQRIKHHKAQKSLCKARSRNIPFIFNSHTLNIFHWAQASEIKLFSLGYFYSCFQIHFFFLFPRMFFFICLFPLRIFSLFPHTSFLFPPRIFLLIYLYIFFFHLPLHFFFSFPRTFFSLS